MMLYQVANVEVDQKRMARVILRPYVKPSKKKRPGIHSKTKQSNQKGSKLYFKKYRGQGR